MNTQQSRGVEAARGIARSAAFAGIVGGLMLGCQSQKEDTEYAVNPALMQIEAPAAGTKADTDRAALARFVGVWNFDGWSGGESGAHRSCAGQAAGTIENEHFVLLDMQATSGQMSGGAGHKSGSMLFASEPDIGATLTAWGSASPSISRFVGKVQGKGSAFSFKEVKTPAGRHQHSVMFTFQTNDSWVAEIHDVTEDGAPIVARYEFTRTKD